MLKLNDNSTPAKASSNISDLDLPKVCSQFGSISQAFETQENIVGDVSGDVMRHLSFDITDIDDHLDVVSCGVVHFVGSCHEVLSHDETFGTDDLDPPQPFDLNIPEHDSEYDADSSKNEEAKYYNDVMIDEENEIHEDKDEVEVLLFGIRDNDYQFTNIGVSSKVLDNVLMEKDRHEMDIKNFDTN
nr:hypothetical protein [Tanacetum cinerariifolium]